MPKALEGGLQIAVQHHGGGIGLASAQVIKHRGSFFKKQRQVVLDARRGYAIAHVFVDAALGRVALQQLAPTASESRTGRLVHRELSPGQQPHFGHGVEAALAVGVKGADAVDFVVEQVHPIRHQRTHGEEVDQAAAHRVFTGADHLADMRVARQGQLGLELGFVELLLDLELKGVARQKGRRSQTVQRRGGGHQHHVGAFGMVALLDAPERGQPLRDQVLVRREGVIRQGFPVREHHAAQIGRKKHQLVHEALGVDRVTGDDGGELACFFLALSQLGQQHGIGRSGRAGQGETFAGYQAGQLHGGDGQWR